MPRKSSVIERLSPEDREQLNKKIGDGGMTLDALVEWLLALGYEISRSSLGRYSADINEVAAKMRESRMVTDALVAEMGDASGLGKQGRLLVEMTRTVVFDLLMKIQADDIVSIGSKDIMQLGKGLAELGRALRLDQDFETKVREEADRKARTAAAASASESMKEAGLSAEKIKFWREEFLGVKKKPDDDG